ncbi:MAG: DUF4239 domain-containing protein [Ignavibacteria bacterium]|nr:DUF4239 domain-containing protein [Ignavibacteria bacterium]
MQFILFALPWPITILIITIVVTAVLVYCRKVYHKRLKPENIRRSHDVSAAVYAILGVLYGIVLGLITIQSQERWIDLRDIREKEASAIVSIGQISKTLSEASSKSISHATAKYALEVARTEWDDDRTMSPEASKAFQGVMNSVFNMESTVDRDLLASQTILQLMSNLMEIRVERLNLIQEHVGTLLWVILVFGGLVMTFFLLLFAPEDNRTHTTMIGIVACIVSSVLFLIFAYEHATDGPLQISGEAYTRAAMMIMDK